jgi:hypothetical protein
VVLATRRPPLLEEVIRGAYLYSERGSPMTELPTPWASQESADFERGERDGRPQRHEFKQSKTQDQRMSAQPAADAMAPNDIIIAVMSITGSV